MDLKQLLFSTFCILVNCLKQTSSGDNTEKIWAHWFFAKQKTDVPKVHKMKTGGLESAACPLVRVRGGGGGGQSLQKVLVFFIKSMVKQQLLKINSAKKTILCHNVTSS